MKMYFSFKQQLNIIGKNVDKPITKVYIHEIYYWFMLNKLKIYYLIQWRLWGVGSMPLGCVLNNFALRTVFKLLDFNIYFFLF